MSRLRSWREVRENRGRRIWSQSVLEMYALLLIWVYSGHSFAEILSRLEINVPCLKNVEYATINVGDADEDVDVVGSTTPVHSDMESEGFTFRVSVSYAFLKNLGGVLDTSGLPLF